MKKFILITILVLAFGIIGVSCSQGTSTPQPAAGEQSAIGNESQSGALPGISTTQTALVLEQRIFHATQTAFANASNTSQEDTAPAEEAPSKLAYVAPHLVHSVGAEDAPVNIVEFGDFQ